MSIYRALHCICWRNHPCAINHSSYAVITKYGRRKRTKKLRDSLLQSQIWSNNPSGLSQGPEAAQKRPSIVFLPCWFTRQNQKVKLIKFSLMRSGWIGLFVSSEPLEPALSPRWRSWAYRTSRGSSGIHHHWVAWITSQSHQIKSNQIKKLSSYWMAALVFQLEPQASVVSKIGGLSISNDHEGDEGGSAPLGSLTPSMLADTVHMTLESIDSSTGRSVSELSRIFLTT